MLGCHKGVAVAGLHETFQRERPTRSHGLEIEAVECLIHLRLVNDLHDGAPRGVVTGLAAELWFERRATAGAANVARGLCRVGYPLKELRGPQLGPHRPQRASRAQLRGRWRQRGRLPWPQRERLHRQSRERRRERQRRLDGPQPRRSRHWPNSAPPRWRLAVVHRADGAPQSGRGRAQRSRRPSERGSAGRGPLPPRRSCVTWSQDPSASSWDLSFRPGRLTAALLDVALGRCSTDCRRRSASFPPEPGVHRANRRDSRKSPRSVG